LKKKIQIMEKNLLPSLSKNFFFLKKSSQRTSHNNLPHSQLNMFFLQEIKFNRLTYVQEKEFIVTILFYFFPIN